MVEHNSLQDHFLNYLRKNKVPLSVFLVSGVKLQGLVSWFDNFCILLRRETQSQLIYKHAISSIMPLTPINLQLQTSTSASKSVKKGSGKKKEIESVHVQDEDEEDEEYDSDNEDAIDNDEQG